MIDTTVIKLHNLSYYPLIEQSLKSLYEKKNIITGFGVENMQEKTLLQKQILFADNNKFIATNSRSFVTLPSSCYNVAVYADFFLDFAEFNFSIPKAKFTQNVMQFINIHSPQNISILYNDFVKFIQNFFIENYKCICSDFDIEIKRIDFCFNQFFTSKNDSLEYLESQKKLAPDFAKSSLNSGTNYSTSLSYVSKNYSFKIYHKGTEFLKNDYKVLQKNNPLKLPLKYFCEKSDLILRYELTCRNALMSYLFKKYHLPIIGKYDLDNIRKNTKYSQAFREYNMLYNASNDNKKFLSFYHVLDNRSCSFFLATNFDINLTPVNFDIKTKLSFDLEIFKDIYNFFWSKFLQYQLSEINNTLILKNKIEANKNNYKKRQNSYATHLILLSLLSEHTDLDILKNYLPKSTFYDLRKVAKKFGVDFNKTTSKKILHTDNYTTYLNLFSFYHK